VADYIKFINRNLLSNTRLIDFQLVLGEFIYECECFFTELSYGKELNNFNTLREISSSINKRRIRQNENIDNLSENFNNLNI
jgi:hypothetical protein